MRNLRVVLTALILITGGCAPAENPGGAVDRSDVCSEFRYLEADALATLRFEYPVEVSNFGYFFCPCANISLADATGNVEHFQLNWPLGSFEDSTLRYGMPEPDGTVVDDEALVDASLVLMGSWVTRTFSPDEIARFSTTSGPKGCKTSEPEMMARVVLGLANQPRYSRLVEAIVCGGECTPGIGETSNTVESPRISVENLAEVSRPRPTRIPGLLLQPKGTTDDQEP